MKLDPKIKKRCKELDEQAGLLARQWADALPNDYSGKILFSMAIARAIRALLCVTPELYGTGDDFIEAVKEGVVIWVEEGEPLTAPKDGVSA